MPLLLLIATLLHHYGYLLFPDLVSVRVYNAFAGVWGVVVLVAVVQLLFKRCTDWRAAMLILLSVAIAFVENAMVAVCKSWYAFMYVGPVLKGNTCTEMTGLTISPFFIASLTLVGVVVMAFSWARSDGDRYSNAGYFIAYQKPGRMTIWKLLATFFTFPYAGKCWIIDGVALRYKAGKIEKFNINLSDYRLVRVNKRPAVWPGKKWSLFQNCVTQ